MFVSLFLCLSVSVFGGSLACSLLVCLCLVVVYVCLVGCLVVRLFGGLVSRMCWCLLPWLLFACVCLCVHVIVCVFACMFVSLCMFVWVVV